MITGLFEYIHEYPPLGVLLFSIVLEFPFCALLMAVRKLWIKAVLFVSVGALFLLALQAAEQLAR